MKDEKNFDSIKNVDEVFQCIMVCQDCICITDDCKLSYSGSSVDEICLLEMVKEVGSAGYLSGRSQDSIQTIQHG